MDLTDDLEAIDEASHMISHMPSQIKQLIKLPLLDQMARQRQRRSTP